MIESSLPVTNFVNNFNVELPRPADSGAKPIGIYLSVRTAERPDPMLLARLNELYEKGEGNAPAYCLILDLGHQGRIDATLFSDPKLYQRAALEMLEDGDLYPHS